MNGGSGSASDGSAHSDRVTDSAAAVAQPKRSPQDSAAFSDAEQAFASAEQKAKGAKTTKDACSALADLMAKLGSLEHVTPPKSFEKEFAEARDGLGMALDQVNTTTCADPQATPDDIVDGINRAQKKLVALESVGAKT